MKNQQPKILVLVNNVWPPPVLITGISVIYACQKELAKLGCEIHILTSKGLWDKDAQASVIDDLYDVDQWHKQEEKKHGIKFHTYSLKFLSLFPKLAFFVNRLVPLFCVPLLHYRYRFDIIHEYTSTPLLIYRSWIFKKVLRNVNIFHSLIAEIPSFWGSPRWLRFFKPKIDGVICANQKIARNLINNDYPWG
jgi:hypothetical protein